MNDQMDVFEDRVRSELHAVAAGVAPSAGLTTRVGAARRRLERRRRQGRAAVAAGVGVAAAGVGVFVLPALPGTNVEAVGVAAASERTTATSFRFETELVGLGETVRAEGEVGEGAEEARFVTTTPLPDLVGAGAGDGVEIVLDDRKVYVHLADVGGADAGGADAGGADAGGEPGQEIFALPDGAEWLAVDLDGRGYVDRMALSLVGTLQDVDPSRPLEVLEEVGADAVEEGPEEIDGVATTRYRFEAGSELEDGDLEDGAPIEVEGRAWIDGEGLLRRVEVTEEGVTATTDLFDFGVETDVEAPPAALVTSLDRFLEEQLGSLSDLSDQ